MGDATDTAVGNAAEHVEFASMGEKWRKMGRAELEAAAEGLEGLGGSKHAARAELVRRDREYSEQQERSRREFEWTLADKQLSHNLCGLGHETSCMGGRVICFWRSCDGCR